MTEKRGIDHQYEALERSGKKLVIDHTTGLTWQQSGSEVLMDYESAKAYVTRLNKENFAGSSDWRLPTLEEAMSLVEVEKKHGDLSIDPVFDDKQRWIWTADIGRHWTEGTELDTGQKAQQVWAVSFTQGGGCHVLYVGNELSVRAVRV